MEEDQAPINMEQLPEVEVETIDENDGLMEKPFDPTLINIETKTPSLDTLIKRIKSKSVELDTENYFQRKDDLWDKQQQSRLIESIIIRFPLPAFFFDASDDNKWLVVDGLQRLSSIRNFCVDKTLKLTNLEFLSQFEGKYWDDLPMDIQRVIEESQVVIYKIMPGTPTDVKFNIFKRINTGGLILEAQEIRHALFQGAPSKFIAELAKNNAFLKATQWRIRTSRMLDRDFANRFLGFYLFGYENYTDLDSYMSKAMAELYHKDEEQLAEIQEVFTKAMKVSRKIFGEQAFRKVYKEFKRLPPINKALFEVLSTQFALLTDDEREQLIDKKVIFKKGLKTLLAEDGAFYDSVTSSTGTRGRVLTRHRKIKELINETIA
ncbi:MAG: DUF262 domain-containing protein [Crocinitomicaceae bacterium]|nr:DUF262 domain-containing protein [Crocinitomicaceae bacterium]